MKNMSGTKVIMIVCSVCFALIAAGVAYTLGVPKKIMEKVRDHKN